MSIGPLAAFGVASALVIVRGVLRPEVTAVALAIVVVVAGRRGGRVAGVSTAVMSAMCFDFFHTEPYLSLKISDATDLVVTLLLLIAGAVAGAVVAPRATDGRSSQLRLSRVLDAARTSTPEDLETAVRAELLGLLKLQDCWYTTDPVLLPVINAGGVLALGDGRDLGPAIELPKSGVAIEVAAYGRHDGYLVCSPTPGEVVSPEARSAAAELGSVLALVRRAA